MSDERSKVRRAAGSGTIDQLEPLLAAASTDLSGTAAMSAAKHGNVELLRALIPRVNKRTLGGCLSGAARLGQAEAAKLVIEAGAPANGPSDEGRPLRDLCQYGEPQREEAYLDILRALLEAGADPNLPSGPNRRFTALHHLAYSGWSATAAKLLVEAGADVLAFDSRSLCVTDLSHESFEGRDKSAVQAYLKVVFEAANKDA